MLGLGGSSLSLGDSGLGLRDSLGQQGCVLGSVLLLLLSVPSLDGESMSLVLESLRGHQSLDLWCLCVCLLALLGDFTSDDKLSDIVLFRQVEESSNLGGPLWSETLWLRYVGETWDVGLTLLDNREGEDGEVVSGDASTD